MADPLRDYKANEMQSFDSLCAMDPRFKQLLWETPIAASEVLNFIQSRREDFFFENVVEVVIQDLRSKTPPPLTRRARRGMMVRPRG